MVTINSAEANRASVRYIKEAVWGSTPTTGKVRELRLTGSSLVATKATKISEEIRADRMVPSVIEVSASTMGDIKTEFSSGTVDDFFEGFLLGTWNTVMNFLLVKGSSVNITSTSKVVLSGSDYTGQIVAGKFVKLEGFKTLGNNGYFPVASVAFTGGNTEVTVVGTPLTIEAGNAYSKFLDSGDVLLSSTATAFEAGNKINGGGSNAFAGKNLQIGQKIYVEGLGKEAGSIQFNATDPVEGATVTVSDGTSTLVFELRTVAGLVTPGNIYVPLSGTPATQAAALAAAVMGQFAQHTTKVYASATTDTVTFHNGALVGGSLAVSDAVSMTVTAFTGGSATKGGVFTIASIPDDDTIVTVETLPVDTNAGGLTVVVKGSHCRNPGNQNEILKNSFSFESAFNDVGQYFKYDGLRVDSFDMKVASGSILTVDFNFMGRKTVTAQAPFLEGGALVNLPTTATEIFNATSNVGALTKNGLALSTAVMSIDLKGTANLRDQRAVGEKFPAGIGYGRFNLTGKITAYFQDLGFYNNFINHETISLGFSTTDVDLNTYYFTMPALKITSDPVSAKQIDTDVMDEMDFVAQRDPVLNTMFMIDRFSSVWPSTVA